MKVHVFESAEAIAKAASLIFAARIISKPNCVLGFATGATPLPLYKELIKLKENNVLNYSNITTFNLDEYVGLAQSHEQSYYRFMHDNLFDWIGVPGENVHFPTSNTDEVEHDCVLYEQTINLAGGIDLQLLGIGHNGHIGFNEPDDCFIADTHIVELSERTIEANKRFFVSADDVPRKAATMGIGTIMKAKEIVLIATGNDKSEAVKAMITGDVNPQCPASILQLHPAVTVFLDIEATEKLTEKDKDEFIVHR